MTDSDYASQLALMGLAQEFPTVPPRILVAIYRCYANRRASVPDAIAATRNRITDACSM